MLDRKGALEEWYEEYGDDMYRFVFYMLGDEQACEDLVQDTFVRACGAMDSFAGRSSIKTWLFGIARRTVADEIRKRQRQRLFLSLLPGKETASPFDLEGHVVLKEEAGRLFQRIMDLKPSYRAVVILRKIEECSTKETAAILGWSEAKVRKNLSRALSILRNKEGLSKGGGSVEQAR